MAVFLVAHWLYPTVVPAGELFADVSGGWRHDDNIGNAAADADIQSDEILRAHVIGGYSHLLGAHASVFAKAGIEYANYHDWKDLTHLGAVAEGAWRYAPQAGYTAPWFQLGARLHYAEYEDSAIRNGYRTEALAMAGRRLSDRIDVRGGYRFEHRVATDGAVFDTDEHRLFVDLDYKLIGPVLLYGNAAVHTGEVVSTATPGPRIHAVAEAIEPDPAPAGPGLNAYRIDADGVSATIGFNTPVPIIDAATFDVAVGYHAVYGEGGNDYDGFIWEAGVFLRF